MERYVFGKEISNKNLLLDLGSITYIKLEGAHWELCLPKHHFNLNHGTRDLFIYIVRLYLM